MYNWIATPLTWDISFKNPKMWVKILTEFPNRYYNGPWGASSSSTVMDLVTFAASPNPNITVKLFPHTYDQPSVIATIPGKSADVVIVSTHFDSINSVNPKLGLAPGAIDNASVRSHLSPAFSQTNANRVSLRFSKPSA
jgi:leucyl aminopeptidase